MKHSRSMVQSNHTHAPFHGNRHHDHKCRNDETVQHGIKSGFFHILKTGSKTDRRQSRNHKELARTFCHPGNFSRNNSGTVDRRQRQKSQNELGEQSPEIDLLSGSFQVLFSCQPDIDKSKYQHGRDDRQSSRQLYHCGKIAAALAESIPGSDNT